MFHTHHSLLSAVTKMVTFRGHLIREVQTGSWRHTAWSPVHAHGDRAVSLSVPHVLSLQRGVLSHSGKGEPCERLGVVPGMSLSPSPMLIVTMALIYRMGSKAQKKRAIGWRPQYESGLGLSPCPPQMSG
jgi:hypothetical protein